jgi:single-strand DNA-binding protein
MNRVLLCGRSGADAEYKATPSGLSVVNLSLAVSKYNKQRKDYDTSWFKVVLFGRLADDVGRDIKKGQEVIVDGELSNSQWTNKEGKVITSTKIIANFVRVAALRNKQQESDRSYGISSGDAGLTEEDIPF